MEFIFYYDTGIVWRTFATILTVKETERTGNLPKVTQLIISPWHLVRLYSAAYVGFCPAMSLSDYRSQFLQVSNLSFWESVTEEWEEVSSVTSESLHHHPSRPSPTLWRWLTPGVLQSWATGLSHPHCLIGMWHPQVAGTCRPGKECSPNKNKPATFLGSPLPLPALQSSVLTVQPAREGQERISGVEEAACCPTLRKRGRGEERKRKRERDHLIWEHVQTMCGNGLEGSGGQIPDRWKKLNMGQRVFLGPENSSCFTASSHKAWPVFLFCLSWARYWVLNSTWLWARPWLGKTLTPLK